MERNQKGEQKRKLKNCTKKKEKREKKRREIRSSRKEDDDESIVSAVSRGPGSFSSGVLLILGLVDFVSFFGFSFESEGGVR